MEVQQQLACSTGSRLGGGVVTALGLVLLFVALLAARPAQGPAWQFAPASDRTPTRPLRSELSSRSWTAAHQAGRHAL